MTGLCRIITSEEFNGDAVSIFISLVDQVIADKLNEQENTLTPLLNLQRELQDLFNDRRKKGRKRFNSCYFMRSAKNYEEKIQLAAIEHTASAMDEPRVALLVT